MTNVLNVFEINCEGDENRGKPISKGESGGWKLMFLWGNGGWEGVCVWALIKRNKCVCVWVLNSMIMCCNEMVANWILNAYNMAMCINDW